MQPLKPPLPYSAEWPAFIREVGWLAAAQYRRDLKKLPRDPAVILEHAERLMQLAWEQRQPQKHYPATVAKGQVSFTETDWPDWPQRRPKGYKGPLMDKQGVITSVGVCPKRHELGVYRVCKACVAEKSAKRRKRTKLVL